MLIRYADPTRCPNCAAVLPPAPSTCPRCGIQLTGPTVEELFATLQRADSLVDVLRTAAARRWAEATAVPEAVPTATGAAPPAGAPARPGSGLGLVPKVLLGLGALFLLVGALTFLAMAWALLGVGGRTAILILITAGVAAGSYALGRRGLRLAAEALALVALGLFTLDLFGAQSAGWLGDLEVGAQLLWFGGLVAAVSVAVTVWPAVGGRTPLAVPQVVAFLALHVACVGLLLELPYRLGLALGMAVVLWLAVGEIARLAHLPLLALGGTGSAALWWLGLTTYALVSFLDGEVATYAHVLTNDAWGPLLVAVCALPLLPRPVGLSRRLLPGTVGGSALIILIVAQLPVLDEGATVGLLALSGALVAGSVLVALSPAPRWTLAAAIPTGWLWLLALTQGLVFATDGIEAIAGAGTWLDAPVGARLAPPEGGAHGLLALAIGVGLTSLAVALQRALAPRRRLAGQLVLAGVATLLLTLVQFDVWLALVVLSFLASAVGGSLTLYATRRRTGGPDWTLAALPAVGLPGALLVAQPSAALTTVALLAIGLACLLLWRHGTGDVAQYAAGVLPLPVALACWTALHSAELDLHWAALLAAVALVPLALWRVGEAVELSAAVILSVSSLACVALHPDPWAWASLHLLVAAVCVFASALLHPSRRRLAFVGGLTLVGSLWCQLAHHEVSTIEAYSLPLAAALLVPGAIVMTQRAQTTSLRGLGGGLAVALLPSLAAVLGSYRPVGMREWLLLGACVGLVLAGAKLRLNTPLVAGGAVGTVMALYLAAPYAYVIPTFIWLGAAGIILTVCGVTWEARLANLRATNRYLTQLR